ncbi:MAG: acyl-CoA dehydratase activase-related protein [Nanoarchaeota archaeon]|nr:acyl-CoA dehydratase activase-related protein [Nanoarchaeota archaeon]
MKKVTYYHIGHGYIAFEDFFKRLGCEPVTPPKITNKTIELGVKHSPDSACFPFKIFVGSFIEAAENGAEVISIYPMKSIYNCRGADYIAGIMKILKRLGYNVEYIPILGTDTKDLLNNMSKLAGRTVGLKEGIKHTAQHLRFLHALDWLEKLCTDTRPYEVEKGDSTKLYNKGLEIFKASESLKKAKKEIKILHEKIKVDNSRTVVKIGFVGDLFALIEPFYNQDIVEKLGDKGVLVDKSLYTNEMLRRPFKILGPFKDKSFKLNHKLAEPYIKEIIGGYSNHCVGRAVWYAQNKFDGVIQMHAFGCMPEINAKAALQKVSRDYEIPIMHLTRDEHSSETGFDTRIDAFVDLIKRKKN